MLGAEVVDQHLELLDLTWYNYEDKQWSRQSARVHSKSAVHGTGREMFCDCTMLAVFRLRNAINYWSLSTDQMI